MQYFLNLRRSNIFNGIISRSVRSERFEMGTITASNLVSEALGNFDIKT